MKNTQDENGGSRSVDHIVRNYLPMEQAPKDGTEVRLLIRHMNYWLLHPRKDCLDWQEEVTGKWIDHNGGGWTWSGMCGRPEGFYIPNMHLDKPRENPKNAQQPATNDNTTP
jgi:hypothetical protein